MAKYVYQLGEEVRGTSVAVRGETSWQDLVSAFGRQVQQELLAMFGLHTCIFPGDDGVELCQGCAGLGKDWFNFKFRIFADTAIYLDMINIPYEWRHRGVGLFLINGLKEFARGHGLGYIFLGSYEPSNPFWEACGFVKITDYPDFVIGIDSMAK